MRTIKLRPSSDPQGDFVEYESGNETRGFNTAVKNMAAFEYAVDYGDADVPVIGRALTATAYGDPLELHDVLVDLESPSELADAVVFFSNAEACHGSYEDLFLVLTLLESRLAKLPERGLLVSRGEKGKMHTEEWAGLMTHLKEIIVELVIGIENARSVENLRTDLVSGRYKRPDFSGSAAAS